MVPFRSLVGSLWYAANATRPDVVYATNVVSQFSQNWGLPHWRAAKRIVRYLIGSPQLCVRYLPGPKKLKIIAYSDSDWAGDTDSRRSRTGYIIYLAEGPVIWQSKMQKTVALSSCEAELYALCECIKELLWLMQFLGQMNVEFDVPVLFCDNQGAIARLAENPVHHQRSKHISVRCFFIRDVVKAGMIVIRYVNTKENHADIFTKPVTIATFLELVKLLMAKYPEV